jgi:hypothetical protein
MVCMHVNIVEYGRMLQADPSKVSARAKKRGLPQLGTLGAGRDQSTHFHICVRLYTYACMHSMNKFEPMDIMR